MAKSLPPVLQAVPRCLSLLVCPDVFCVPGAFVCSYTCTKRSPPSLGWLWLPVSQLKSSLQTKNIRGLWTSCCQPSWNNTQSWSWLSQKVLAITRSSWHYKAWTISVTNTGVSAKYPPFSKNMRISRCYCGMLLYFSRELLKLFAQWLLTQGLSPPCSYSVCMSSCVSGAAPWFPSVVLKQLRSQQSGAM